MPRTGEKNSGGCFSDVLSRLLCSSGLPTHPSERLIEPRIEKLEHRKASEIEESAKSCSNPGVVARLMGLESFPAENCKERTLGDYFRSRSVNSIDFLSHFDPVKPRNDRHRRVKTSVSFREGLSDEFAGVVLLLEEEFQAKIEEEMREKNRKAWEGKDAEIEEKRKSVYGKNVEIKVKRKSVHGNSSLKKNLEGKRRADLKERRPVVMKGGEELKKKKSKINSANKLNCEFKKIHPQPQGTAPEVERVASPRKHQPSQTANSQPQSSCSVFSESVIIAEKNEAKKKSNENLCYKKMVEEICMLTEESVSENWIYGMELKFENFEEICQEFGQEILELLLKQFVDELVLNFGYDWLVFYCTTSISDVRYLTFLGRMNYISNS